MSTSPKIGGGEPSCGVFGRFGHFGQGKDDGTARERFALSEAYREEGLLIRYLVERFDRPLNVEVNNKFANSRHHRVCGAVSWEALRGDQFLKVGNRHLDTQPYGKDGMVLVAVVDVMDGMEISIPAQIRLERVNLIDDLFGGDVHLSGSDGRFQPLRVLGEREPDTAGVFCLSAHYPKRELIEGRPKIVDSITNDKGELVWNGAIVLKKDKSVGGIAALSDSQLERRVREKFGNFPVQIVDVLFGPLNLHERAA